MAKALLHVLRVIRSSQAGERIVVVVVFTFARIEQAGQVAGFVVVVVAAVELVLLLSHRVGV